MNEVSAHAPARLLLEGSDMTAALLLASRTVVQSPRAGRGDSVLLAHIGSAFARRAGANTLIRLEASRVSITSHLSFFRGEDIVLDFQMSPSVNVTGWTISLKLADTLGGTVQFVKAASIVDGPRGRFRVSLESADTASLAVGRYVWDARRTDAGNKATLADGTLDLRQEVTA